MNKVAKSLVANVVSKGVVDALEVVEIGDKESQWFAVGGGLSHCQARYLHEGPPSEGAGEGVVGRQVKQAVVGALVDKHNETECENRGHDGGGEVKNGGGRCF